MAITRRCDYAFRILRAAYRNRGAYVSISEVAENEGIPYSFARSIQHDLVKEGFLTTTRGVHGGLALSCDPQVTTVYDVLEKMQDSPAVAECVDCNYPCKHRKDCVFNAVWRAADVLLGGLYSSITLAELFEQGEDHPAIQAALAQAK